MMKEKRNEGGGMRNDEMRMAENEKESLIGMITFS